MEDGRQGGAERLDPLANVVFVRVVGGSEEVAGGIARALAGRAGVADLGEVVSVHAEHAELGGSVSVKYPRLDVRIVCERAAPGGRVVVDLESERSDSDVEGRFLYYAAKELAGSIAPGDGYAEMPDVVSVILYDGGRVHPASEGFLSTCRLAWDCGGDAYPGADRLVFVLVELRKFRDLYPDLTDEVLGDEVLSWLYLLTQGYKDDAEMEAIMEALQSAEQFAERYKLALDDPETRHAYEQYLWSWRTECSIRRQAEEAGRAKGRESALDGVAAAMREQGYDEDAIGKVLAAAG